MSVEVEDWHLYFEAMRLEREEAEREAEEADEILEIIEASRPAIPEDVTAPTLRILGLLALCGFVSASQVTRVFLPGKVFKTGERAGERRADKEMTNVFVHAANPKDRRTVSLWYQDGKLVSAVVGSALTDKVGELEGYIWSS